MINSVGPSLVGLPRAAQLALLCMESPVDLITVTVIVIEHMGLVQRPVINSLERLSCVHIGYLDLVVGVHSSMDTHQRDQKVHDAPKTSIHAEISENQIAAVFKMSSMYFDDGLG